MHFSVFHILCVLTNNCTICTILWLLFFSFLASDDFMALNNSFHIKANTPLQCVPISITSDSVDEADRECFTFSITTSANVAGLTLSPFESKICISDAEGIVPFINIFPPEQSHKFGNACYGSDVYIKISSLKV